MKNKMTGNYDWKERIHKFIKFKISDVKLYNLFLSMFFLPLSMKLNNIFLVVFIIAYIIEGGFFKKINNIKKYFIYITPIVLLFTITILGSYNSYFSENAFNQVERSVPFVIIPIIFISEPKLFFINRNKILWSLVVGSLISFVIIWSNFYFNIILKLGFKAILTWEYGKGYLTKVLNHHPTYLSIFVIVSIIFLYTKIFNNKLVIIKKVAIIVLIFFLFSLLSRTAIIFFLLSSLIVLLFRKRYMYVCILFSISTILFLFLINSKADKSDFFEKTLIKELNFTDVDDMDKRIYRWESSWQLFKEKPILGYGTGDVDIVRNIKYRENNDVLAYKEKYNAHNQFFEELSAHGVIGGVVYLINFILLIIISIKSKDFMNLYFILLILAVSTTESIFKRSYGIVFFAILASMLIVNYISTIKKYGP